MFSPDGRRTSVDFTSAAGRDVWLLDRGDRISRATFVRDGRDATCALTANLRGGTGSAR